MLTKAPKGTKDVLPSTSGKWQYIEDVVRDICARYGYREIRTPVFEHTELFLRGVGGTTDIVQKEMYTFEDKGGRSITLRPEGTAGGAQLLWKTAFMRMLSRQKCTISLRLCSATSVRRPGGCVSTISSASRHSVRRGLP